MGKLKKPTEKPVMDRRAAAGKERRGGDRRKQQVPVAVERRQLERRAKVNRRRQIDPTTCERDYTDQEVEFMNALDEYKRKSGRMFPTCSEILEVLLSLGYEKRDKSHGDESVTSSAGGLTAVEAAATLVRPTTAEAFGPICGWRCEPALAGGS